MDSISLIRNKSDTTQKAPLLGETIEFFLIRVFTIEESETTNTYVGKKDILFT
jgi:hypothetical protein